ncbi:hypothetical protein F4677DRAFT_119052 [Hypoxylon crocopeplum]|nr:hypothetical protein F4677DRAFT_119052 [Hypoxylon crocopeplum]
MDKGKAVIDAFTQKPSFSSLRSGQVSSLSDEPKRGFSDLPREIRNIIWEYAAPPIMHLSLQKSDKIFLPVPGCFHINREAREEIARHTLFVVNIHQNIDSNEESDLNKNPCFRHLRKFIRRLVTCLCAPQGGYNTTYSLLDPSVFPKLQEVYAIQYCPFPKNIFRRPINYAVMLEFEHLMRYKTTLWDLALPTVTLICSCKRFDFSDYRIWGRPTYCVLVCG